MQSTIDFTTNSPINSESLGKQNKVIYEYLLTHDSINMTIGVQMGIYSFHSRLAELRKVVQVYDKYIRVGNTTVKSYSLKPFEDTAKAGSRT
jgi:hypothetical protein